MASITFILNGAIDNSGIFSGGDRHTVGLIKYCIAQGDQVRIIAPKGTMLNHSENLSGAQWTITEKGPLPNKYRFGRTTFTLLKYLFRTISGSLAKSEPCDIIYSGSILPHETLIAYAWKKRSLCQKYVCRCDQVFHLEPFRQKPEYIIQRIASRLGMRIALASADLVITMNTLIAAQWQNAIKSRSATPQIESLLYGLDDDITPFKGQNEKKYDLSFFCRLDYVKGADLVPNVLSSLSKKKPDIKMLIIGDGPLRKNMEAKIKDLGLEDNVTWKGIINSCERFNWLDKSKVLLYPTREDSFAKSVAEALAMGIPVVSSNNPHFNAVYGDTILYAESENPDSYANSIANLLSDNVFYTKYVEKSLNFAHTLPEQGNYAQFQKLILET